MISIVLLLQFFFNKLYCMHCLYNVVVVVVVVEINFNSIHSWISPEVIGLDEIANHVVPQY